MTSRISPSVGAPAARIVALGAYRPERVVTNAEICERIDSTDEWIRERSGIIERRYAAADESVIDMAVTATRIAVERAGISPEEIGMVLVATVTHPFQTPSAAAEVAFQLGATRAAAMDISAACAGFCYGLALASDMIRGGSARYVAVVGVEKLTDWIDPTDRGTAFLFADAAGAAIIGPADEPGIGPVVWGADGSQAEAICMTDSLIEYRDRGLERFPTLSMQGQQVFRWAVGEMPGVVSEALERAGVTADDLSAFIPHQANMRITDAMVRAMRLPEHVPVARDIAYTGNTSAASIPLAMDRMLTDGEAPHGGLALLVGFGAGLVHAAQVVVLP